MGAGPYKSPYGTFGVLQSNLHGTTRLRSPRSTDRCHFFRCWFSMQTPRRACQGARKDARQMGSFRYNSESKLAGIPITLLWPIVAFLLLSYFSRERVSMRRASSLPLPATAASVTRAMGGQPPARPWD